ncbi:MAG TPA: bifunctional serine/threonine-protein kinase/formylglycine-generating enzyme family protein [Anaerolineaceae bacterium]|nr:bifunctional serine/threonine-protein kinase/formylglycine-generating enzyme family protein [Anaerolineaceae bacterium]
MGELKRLGRYVIDAQLGSGAYADVYRAQDEALKRLVALKVLKPALIADEEAFGRFMQEAQVAAQLFHPHIATVLDVGQAEGYYFIAMRYVDGPALAQLLEQKGPLPWDQAAKICTQIGQALEFAHGRGLVHRDIKPQNILVSPTEGAILTDFGLVRAMEASNMATRTGALIGTPPYIAPEVWQGQPATAAADQYALACVLYEMLTGRPLFTGPSPWAIMQRHSNPPELPDQWPAGCPAGLSGILQRALAKQPEARYPTIAALMAEIEAAPEAEKALRQEKAAGQEHLDTRHPAAGLKQPPGSTQPISAAAGQQAAAEPDPQAVEKPGLSEPPQDVRHLLPETHPNPEEQPTNPGVSLHKPAVDDGGQQASTRPEPRPARRKKNLPKWALGLLGLVGLGILILFLRLLGWFDPPPPRVTIVNSSTPPDCTSAGTGWISPVDGMTLVCVPAGHFLMGSSMLDFSADSDEKPQHRVSLDAYWMDQTEVTNAQYARCVAAGACRAPESVASNHRDNYYGNSEYANYPVIYVSWDDAVDYCTWAGRELPSEAEWEKAARGTDGRIYPWGNQAPNSGLLNFYGNIGDTTAVGSYPDGASPYGALDMAGNVWEWTADWYDGNYYSSQTTWRNPSGPVSGEARVLRGGSWDDISWFVRAAVRLWGTPDRRFSSLGFRCRLSP